MKLWGIEVSYTWSVAGMAGITGSLVALWWIRLIWFWALHLKFDTITEFGEWSEMTWSIFPKLGYCTLQVGCQELQEWTTRSINGFIGYKGLTVHFMVSSKDFNQPQQHNVCFLRTTYLQSAVCKHKGASAQVNLIRNWLQCWNELFLWVYLACVLS